MLIIRTFIGGVNFDSLHKSKEERSASKIFPVSDNVLCTVFWSGDKHNIFPDAIASNSAIKGCVQIGN
ncbi:MAG TPA: hypothetical protein GX708_01830 [Gallicola sp.]|nr:hypothetical protein [Gallicola sp.]